MLNKLLPNNYPKTNKCIVVILAEGLKLNVKNIHSRTHIKLWSANLSSKSENFVLAKQALQQKMRACMCRRETVAVVNLNSWERAEPMLKGDRTSFTHGFSIITFMVSILSFVFIKSRFTYYIVFCRIPVNSRLYWCHVGVYNLV